MLGFARAINFEVYGVDAGHCYLWRRLVAVEVHAGALASHADLLVFAVGVGLPNHEFTVLKFVFPDQTPHETNERDNRAH